MLITFLSQALCRLTLIITLITAFPLSPADARPSTPLAITFMRHAIALSHPLLASSLLELLIDEETSLQDCCLAMHNKGEHQALLAALATKEPSFIQSVFGTDPSPEMLAAALSTQYLLTNHLKSPHAAHSEKLIETLEAYANKHVHARPSEEKSYPPEIELNHGGLLSCALCCTHTCSIQ